ncbi:hypothetical protein CAPTEDRAFT_170504 [Capitella teleta]|uniref:BZIP domain-containing protein n=1 Tax=Capitella teleta TaxID=283909 RepID=R7UJR7_CAPTE|nr:hypothetical protein CAPTEDRAFT_170504 [Capitella teleta]|eukprot:ELU03492.1 hypothetical protein CAPTEDRAFT_170504 [Capitella teleta]
MYNSVPTSNQDAVALREREDKMTVATLLSSLASGGHTQQTQYSSATGILTPTTLTQGIPSSGTITTPMLTPSTLLSIEQVFALHNTQEKDIAVDLTTESGFVPPLVGPKPTSSIPVMVKQEYDEHEFVKEDPEWLPSGAKRQRLMSDSEGSNSSFMLPDVSPNSTVTASGSRRPTGPRPQRSNQRLTNEEEEKRSVRRERNKQAAAKCRQRRVDLTNRLLNETEGLEEDQADLEEEIQKLQAQKEQLEFLLEAHRPLCKVSAATPASSYTVTIASSAGQPSIKLEKTLTPPPPPPQRPTSLGIAATSATGIPISTPSNGISVFNFGLEAMVDGHTGLTPLTQGPPSCASQIQRSDNPSITSSATTLSSPTTLMAL